MLLIRHAAPTDVPAIAAVEAACFPAAEAASEASFARRVAAFPSHFYLMLRDGKLVSFVNGFVTDLETLTDDMYANAAMHTESGRWQMVFGVDTIPEARRNGYAAMLLRQMIADARVQGRAGLVLTCKDHMVHYYAKFGFVNEGRSESDHGGAVWNQMRLTF